MFDAEETGFLLLDNWQNWKHIYLNLNRCAQALFKPCRSNVTKTTGFILRTLHHEAWIIYTEYFLGNITWWNVGQEQQKGYCRSGQAHTWSPAPRCSCSTRPSTTHSPTPALAVTSCDTTRPVPREPQTQPGQDTDCCVPEPADKQQNREQRAAVSAGWLSTTWTGGHGHSACLIHPARPYKS